MYIFTFLKFLFTIYKLIQVFVYVKSGLIELRMYIDMKFFIYSQYLEMLIIETLTPN